MPTFTPFRTINLFRSPATKQSVNYFGSSGGGQPSVTTSSLDEVKKSVPFWWLLHKLTFSVGWNGSVDRSPDPPLIESGSFAVDFIVNESPNDKICRTGTDPSFVNLIEGGFETQPNFAEISIISGSDNLYEPDFNIEPFKCDFVHSLFYVGLDDAVASTSLQWYITSGPKIDLSNTGGQSEHILEEEINITLPNNETASLFMYCIFGNAGYGPAATASTTMQLDSIEWWELA